jgi:catechol 2,3-dioxygenase-like lactoylglutathione lyase family enzyme
MASIRYLVNNVDESIQFYTQHLGFELLEQYGPAMAIVKKADLTLWLAGPASSAAQPMADGSLPKAGGWNRFVLQVSDLTNLVANLKKSGVQFKNEIVSGPGGQQILCCDPSDNVIELFQPKN